ncbi:TPA: hypothetical protein ACFNM3_001693 [Neisseria lactamica]|uniref:hypothetical protein n=1 Tax=Neisseria lactamica TaxID=486 RepID=UPI0013B38742|nr:hypothetical protein [Neisseria lactamica]
MASQTLLYCVNRRRLLHFVASTFALDALKVTAAFAPYRIAEDDKSDENVAFVLPIAYDQLAACFTGFVSASRIGKLRLCDAKVFEQLPYIRMVIDR